MFFDPRVTKVFIYTPPVDCRKAHNGLVFIVTNVMTQEFASGDIKMNLACRSTGTAGETGRTSNCDC